MPPQFVCEMHGVSKSYGDKVVLRDISLSFFYGAKIGVVGENGSGMAWANGDYNGDGAVNGGDLVMLGTYWNWAAPAAPENGAVPEPATLTLLGLGGLAFVRRRK